jgi:hypothetical protein
MFMQLSFLGTIKINVTLPTEKKLEILLKFLNFSLT